MGILVRALLLVLVAGCIHVANFIPEPSATSAPDGCVWVVKEGPGALWWKSVSLCCAAPPKFEPICREAIWKE